MKESRDETIKRLAYVIWQDRCRKCDPEACNEKQNYFRAKYTLYPEDMKLNEIHEL